MFSHKEHEKEIWQRTQRGQLRLKQSKLSFPIKSSDSESKLVEMEGSYRPKIKKSFI